MNDAEDLEQRRARRVKALADKMQAENAKRRAELITREQYQLFKKLLREGLERVVEAQTRRGVVEAIAPTMDPAALAAFKHALEECYQADNQQHIERVCELLTDEWVESLIDQAKSQLPSFPRAAHSLEETIKSDPDRELRSRVRKVATEEEVSAALGTPWPWYRGAKAGKLPPTPPTDALAQVVDANVHAERVGGRLTLRGNPFRACPGDPELGIQKTAVFGQAALRLYDLLAARIPVRKRRRFRDRKSMLAEVVKPVCNMKAAALAAEILNTLPGWCWPGITAADMKSRVQARSRE